jgi:hypothetical protein
MRREFDNEAPLISACIIYTTRMRVRACEVSIQFEMITLIDMGTGGFGLGGEFVSLISALPHQLWSVKFSSGCLFENSIDLSGCSRV